MFSVAVHISIFLLYINQYKPKCEHNHFLMRKTDVSFHNLHYVIITWLKPCVTSSTIISFFSEYISLYITFIWSIKYINLSQIIMIENFMFPKRKTCSWEHTMRLFYNWKSWFYHEDYIVSNLCSAQFAQMCSKCFAHCGSAQAWHWLFRLCLFLFAL